MRLYCPECGDTLLIKHKIELEILSEFDWKSDIVTLTNHFISKSRKTNALMPTKDISEFICRNCKHSCVKERAYFKCDDCGRNFPPGKATAIGQSIIVCKKCLNENTSLEFFKIFGKRGPTKKTREDRTDRIMDEAGAEIREVQPPSPADAVFNFVDTGGWTTGGTGTTNV